jgi:hypothetical protein
MSKNRDRSRVYRKAEAIKFVEGLGTWTAENRERALVQRTDQDYRESLYNLIKVNRNRLDDISDYETDAAYHALAELEKMA